MQTLDASVKPPFDAMTRSGSANHRREWGSPALDAARGIWHVPLIQKSDVDMRKTHRLTGFWVEVTVGLDDEAAISGEIDMKKMMAGLLAGAALAVTVTAAEAQQRSQLEQVRQRGMLNCGSNTGLAGFGTPDAQGNWTGLDVDYCRAIAAAIFDDPAKVRFVPLTAQARFTALQSGEVDVLVRNSTWTMTRDTTLGIAFAATNYYDGQGFMVRKSLGVTSAMKLEGAQSARSRGTTTELNLADFFRKNNMRYTPVTFATADETRTAYEAGRCDAFTTDASASTPSGSSCRARTTTSCCRRSSPRSRWPPPCAPTATCSGSTS